jgi:hypothetical protein
MYSTAIFPAQNSDFFLMVFPKDIYLFILKLTAHFYLIYTVFSLSCYTFDHNMQKNIKIRPADKKCTQWNILPREQGSDARRVSL